MYTHVTQYSASTYGQKRPLWTRYAQPMAWRQLTQTSGPDHIRWYQGPSCACYGSQARTLGLRGDHRDILQHCVLIYNGPACRTAHLNAAEDRGNPLVCPLGTVSSCIVGNPSPIRLWGCPSFMTLSRRVPVCP